MSQDGRLSSLAADLRAADPDRWLLTLFATPDRRQDLVTLACFNLELARNADQVSQPMLGEIRLQWWRDAVAGIEAGTPRETPVILALAELLARAPGLSRFLARMIDARGIELYPEPPADLAALERYLADSSGALNGAWVALCGAADAGAVAMAERLGIAFGLVGVIRSVERHARAGRVLLPADHLARAGLGADDLRQRDVAGALRAPLAALADRADELLSAPVPKSGPELRPVTLGAALTRLYLRRLRQADYDIRRPRIHPGVPRRQIALLRAALLG